MRPASFPPPHTFCDGACTRCPLASSCELSTSDTRPAFTSPEVPGPFSVAREHVVKKGLVALDELRRISDRLLEDAPARRPVEAAMHATGRLTMAAARLRATGRDIEDFAMGLLLLEKVLGRAESALVAAETELGARLARTRRSIASIHEAIDPHVARVPEAFRAELARRVRDGRAPSPFADG